MEILLCRRSLVVVAGMKHPNEHAEPKKVELENNNNKSVRVSIQRLNLTLWVSLKQSALCIDIYILIQILMDAYTLSTLENINLQL